MDIFNRQISSYGGSFAADSATLTFPSNNGNLFDNTYNGNFGLLVQQMRLSYQQNVTRLYEVGSPKIYFVGGRVAGTFNLGRVVGPAKIAQGFYSKYGDLCKVRENTVSFELTVGCDSASERADVGYDCHFCIITGVDMQVAAENMLINENVTMMFGALEHRVTGAAGINNVSPPPILTPGQP